MDTATGLVILGEFMLLGAVIWGAAHERALIALERAAAKKTRARVKKRARRKMLLKTRRLNAKALYTPVMPPESSAGEKAA